MSTEIAKIPIVDEAEIVKYLEVMGLANKLTANEKTSFIQIAKLYKLNPFKREIYAVKYKEGEAMSIITGYETYLKRAERHGALDGWGVTYEGSVKDRDLCAIITIHRKDHKIPLVHRVYYSEYVQEVAVYEGGNKTDKKQPNKFWHKAHTMLGKVAIAQGFRLAFPDEMGGMPYTADELPETIDIPTEEIKTGEKSSSAPVVAVPMQPTPQPTIDNHVHACNAIKKEQTDAELKAHWERIDLPTQSHPAVIDEMAAALVGKIQACDTEDKLKVLWKFINTIGKDKEVAKFAAVVKTKDDKKAELTTKK